jgi:hypothetical protein
MASSIILAVSDTHVGSSTSLCPPKFTIHTDRADETQLVEYNEAQKWLHACFTDLVDYAKQLAGVRGKTRKHRLIFIHLGDVCDGLHHGSVQVMNEIPDQIEAACNLLRPIVALADDSYLTYGTGPAHTGEAAGNEISLARELGMKHGWHWSLDIDGMVVDITHHGRAGQQDWTSAAPALAMAVAGDYIKDGKMPPRYVLRGHVHKVDDSGAKLPYSRAIVIPSWQLKTAHGHKAAPNQQRADIGGLILDTANPDNPDLSRIRYAAPGGFIKTVKV